MASKKYSSTELKTRAHTNKLNIHTLKTKKKRVRKVEELNRVVMYYDTEGGPRMEFKSIPRGILMHRINSMQKIALIKCGIPKSNLINIKNALSFDYDTLQSVLSINKRTIQNKGDNALFDSNVSEKIVGIAMLYSFGLEVFEDEERFKNWFVEANYSLGGKSPSSLIDTITGIEEVNKLIGRIEHGVY